MLRAFAMITSLSVSVYLILWLIMAFGLFEDFTCCQKLVSCFIVHVQGDLVDIPNHLTEISGRPGPPGPPVSTFTTAN